MYKKSPPQKNDLMHFMNVFLRGAAAPGREGRFKGSLFGKSYETKYCVYRVVIWHDAKKVIQVLLFFCYGFVNFIFVFCLPGFSNITFVILDEFWFCFLHLVQFINPHHRAK